MNRSPTVAAMLAATVARVPERTALVEGATRLTWRELADAVERLATVFRARGIGPADGVGIVLANDEGFVPTFLAVQSVGAMAVPVNPQFTVEELGRHLDAAPVVAVVAEPGSLPALRDWASTAARQPWVDDVAALTAAAPGRAPALTTPCDGAAAALFAFSSGSTGTPKGMVRTNANLVAEAEQFTTTVEVDESDVILAVVPLFHAHGLGNALLAAVRSGATLVTGRFERDATLAAIERERVTLFPGVPFIFRTLAETRRTTRSDLASLRLCFSAGAPLDRETFDLFHDRIGIPVRQLYGCSEAGSVTINLDPDAMATATSVGRPMAGVELTVAGPDGEIAFRSGALTAGYVGGDAAANAAFVDGWFRTGDVGHLDEAGNLYVTGRTTLYIATEGHKVDPFEVEAVLREQPGVADVVVVGVPGERGEQIVKAVVVADPAVVLDDAAFRRDLQKACRHRLAPFKVPRQIELRDEIPRSPLGKVLRKYLV